MTFGAVGKNIYDTYSPLIHQLFGNDEYTLLNIIDDEFDNFILSKEYTGINLVGDYQIKVLSLCDELSERALEIGAANVLLKRDDGSLYADNTECDAFKFLVVNNDTRLSGKQCFVLGSGGTSLSVSRALFELGAKSVERVSRSGELNYVNLYDNSDAEIIVNTTPVGQYPDYRLSMVNATRFQRLRAVYDLICYPTKTQLMLDAMVDYTPAYGGLMMLVKSCADSLKLFKGVEITDDKVMEVYRHILLDVQNILLIGMEGCGANLVGAELSRSQNRELLDFDTEFKNKYGMDQDRYANKFGEVEYRNAESELLNDLTALNCKIICCGGEIMSPKDNRFSMKRNSAVIWLERDEALQRKDGISYHKIIGNHKTYIYRQPLYIESSDFNFTNNKTPKDCAEKILDTLLNYRIM